MPRTHASIGLLLAILFLISYLVGLDSHGITNWQEGIRLLAAQDMAERSDWIVPTIAGEPYLAKPPLIYWAQLLSAEIRGAAKPTLFDLRLVVSIAGLVGLLATYLAARVLLSQRRDDDLHPPDFAPRASLWAVAFAGTGILFFRSSRIGELDVLLVPTVAACIAFGASAVLSQRSPWLRVGSTILALMCASLAALAKGPAGLLVIACALPVGLTLSAFLTSGDLTQRIRHAALGWLLAVGCAGAAFGSLALWTSAVANSIGQENIATAIQTEAGENLRLFVADAWLKNLEALAYGCGLASVLLVPAFGRLLVMRPPARLRITPGLWIIIAWIACSFIAFSLTTKGVARYLTPVWPGVALLAGWWIVQRIEETKSNPRLNPKLFCLVVLTILGVGQTFWYAIGREMRQGDRTPRALADELLEMGGRDEITPGNVGSYDLWSPALDLDFGFSITPWKGPANTADTPHLTPRPIEDLATQLRAEPIASYVLLVRDGPVRGRPEAGLAIDQLDALGLVTEPIETDAIWTIDNGRTEVIPVRIRVPDNAPESEVDPG